MCVQGSETPGIKNTESIGPILVQVTFFRSGPYNVF